MRKKETCSQQSALDYAFYFFPFFVCVEGGGGGGGKSNNTHHISFRFYNQNPNQVKRNGEFPLYKLFTFLFKLMSDLLTSLFLDLSVHISFSLSASISLPLDRCKADIRPQLLEKKVNHPFFSLPYSSFSSLSLLLLLFLLSP